MYLDIAGLSLLLGNPHVQLEDRITILFYGVLLSQIISNVPATILLVYHVKDWIMLTISVNLGGLGLASGSLANIITIRLGRINLRDFHKYTLPYFTLLSAIVALAMLIA